MLTYIEGDLFDDKFDEPTIIAHVCNDQGAWGSGFVVPLEKRFNESAACYRAWHRGELTEAHLDRLIYWDKPPFERGQVQFVRAGNPDQGIVVANMVAQTLGGARPIYYNSLARCMDRVADMVHSEPCRIICPMFGAGLAGGDWLIVEKLIEDCWVRENFDVTVYYFTRFLPDNFTPPPTGDFQVELRPDEFCFTKCNRCGTVSMPTGPKEPPSMPIMVGGERCQKCSGYMMAVTDPAEVDKLRALPRYSVPSGLDTAESVEAKSRSLLPDKDMKL